MKPNYNNKYRKKYVYLNTYCKKHLRTKVRKNFMSDKEFLGIYNLYININTEEDVIFILNMIRTSNVFRHYNINIIYSNKNVSVQEYLNFLLTDNGNIGFDIKFSKIYLSPIIEWLFSHTIHTNSLNSVTFK